MYTLLSLIFRGIIDSKKYYKTTQLKKTTRVKNKQKLKKAIRPQKQTKTEKDYKGQKTNIDPQGCKDVDDAVSIKSGELAIHISTPTKLIDGDLKCDTF